MVGSQSKDFPLWQGLLCYMSAHLGTRNSPQGLLILSVTSSPAPPHHPPCFSSSSSLWRPQIHLPSATHITLSPFIFLVPSGHLCVDSCVLLPARPSMMQQVTEVPFCPPCFVYKVITTEMIFPCSAALVPCPSFRSQIDTRSTVDEETHGCSWDVC